jgi:hypothetical protein
VVYICRYPEAACLQAPSTVNLDIKYFSASSDAELKKVFDSSQRVSDVVMSTINQSNVFVRFRLFYLSEVQLHNVF